MVQLRQCLRQMSQDRKLNGLRYIESVPHNNVLGSLGLDVEDLMRDQSI